jgi:hypothetical protein
LLVKKKYGATMMGEIKNEVKDLNRFLVDVQEELMDALLYIEAARYCLGDEIEEAMLKRMNIIGQNGNDGYIMIRKKFKKRSKKKGPVQAKKISYDGINFASGLERYMYMALKKLIYKLYTKDKHTRYFLGLIFLMKVYERCGNGKGDYKNRGSKKILNIKYTPDFIGKGFIIETKGRANESFPIRWKMFKRYVVDHLPGVHYINHKIKKNATRQYA